MTGYTDPSVAFNPFDASIATGTDETNLVKVGGQWTHLFGNSVEANINGGFVQSFATHSGIVATVTGDGTVVPTIGNQSWFEYGGRLGFRITKGWVADLFVNGTAGPQPVGNTVHGGVGLRMHLLSLVSIKSKRGSRLRPRQASAMADCAAVAAATSIHITSQIWPSGSSKLRPYMKP